MHFVHSSVSRRWLIGPLILTGLLVAALAMSTARPASAQETGAAEIYTLPASWQGDATADLETISDVAPPFQVIDASGDFLFTHLSADGDDVIRILPNKQGGDPGRSLLLAWPISESDTEPRLSPGSVFVLGASARAFSPPAGVMLTLREFDGETWSSSSTPMQEVAWTGYSVSRQIDDDAVEVQVGLSWTLPDEDAWIELSNMELAVFPTTADANMDLSPTDTPTPLAPSSAATGDGVPSLRTGPLIVVTSTPTPPNVFAAATQKAAATEWASVLGTATPTPDNMVTATPSPTPLVVTNTPTPANDATATYNAAVATAMAATTGTPTPLPDGVTMVVATSTPTRTAIPKPKAKATAVPSTAPKQKTKAKTTPIYVLVDDLIFPTSTPTPEFPSELQGKILFLSDYLAKNIRNPRVFMINPDGTGLALLTSREFYDRAKDHDAYSADKRFYAYSQRETLGGRKGIIQVYYNDSEYSSQGHQLTYFGDGTAWAPSFSPTDSWTIALVSNESENDEIWIARREQWPPTQLTKNDWEWDRSPSFSPDGTQIAFESNRIGGTRQIWLMDASGQNQRQITNFPFEAWEPVWVKYTDY